MLRSHVTISISLNVTNSIFCLCDEAPECQELRMSRTQSVVYEEPNVTSPTQSQSHVTTSISLNVTNSISWICDEDSRSNEAGHCDDSFKNVTKSCNNSCITNSINSVITYLYTCAIHAHKLTQTRIHIYIYIYV